MTEEFKSETENKSREKESQIDIHRWSQDHKEHKCA
jgi:hypothetical protein